LVLVGLVATPVLGQDPAPAAGEPAQAQPSEQATVPKIAVVNGDRIIVESTVGQAAQQRANEITATWEERVNAKRDELNALVTRRQNELETLTAQTLGDLNQQIEGAQLELTRLQEDANRELGRSGQQAQAEISARLMSALDLVARQNSYDLIFDTRTQGLLWISEAVDATDQVLALMNGSAGG
jgi:Skp family chaperone for outer membrane proteins